MSRRRKKYLCNYTGKATRQQVQEKQQQKELREAKQGIIEATNAEIAREVEREFRNLGERTIARKIESDPPPIEKEEKPRRWYVVDTNLILSCVNVLYDAQDEEWREPKNFKPRLNNADIIIPYVVFEELNYLKDEVSYRGMIARKALRRLVKFFPNSGRSLDQIMYLDAPIRTGWGTQTISLLPVHRDFSKILPWVPSRDDNDGWIAVTALAATLIREGLPVDGTTDYVLEDGAFNALDIMKRDNSRKEVILLTNDRHLLSKADLFGVHSRSYSFEKPALFTGCRELTVPVEMFNKFYYENGLSREEFEMYLPDEPELVANEYIIMNLEDTRDLPHDYFDDGVEFKNIARYHKKNDTLRPLRFARREGRTPANAGIATYYDAMNDDKIQVVNVMGKAGTGKTYSAIVHAIRAVKAGEFVQIILIPSKSAKNPLGALPGDKEHKMEPLVAAAKNAIRSYLANTPEFRRKRELLSAYGDKKTGLSEEEYDGSKKHKSTRNDRSSRDARRTRGNYTGNFDDLDFGYDDLSPEDFGDAGHSKKKKNKTFYPGKSEKSQNNDDEGKISYHEALEREVNRLYSRYFVCIPYEEAQGDSYEDSIIIVDEAQRLKVDDADTILSRPAKNSKLFVMGDVSQIHDSSPEKQLSNALCYSRMLFGDWDGCANIYLTENLRSDIAEIMTRNRDKVRRMMGLI